MDDGDTQRFQHFHAFCVKIAGHRSHTGFECLSGLIAWGGAQIEEALARVQIEQREVIRLLVLRELSR